jgi:hypothetical protein
MNADTTLTGISAIAEVLVAWVIYYELEGGRLDQFLSDSDSYVEDRQRIYRAFCGLGDISLKEKREAFKELLERGEDEKLRSSCHQVIRLVSRIGARLPRIWWLKRTPVDWHVAALLWIVLGPYVEERRQEAGPTYAESFVRYALASTKRLLAQRRDTWIIRDPDRTRREDVQYSRKDVLAIRKELKLSLKRKG